MAEEKPKHKRKHLKAITSEQAEDGSIVHHHTYTHSKSEDRPEEHRRNVATSDNADEAGEHVAEQFAMNQQGQGDPGADQGAATPGEGAPPTAGEAPEGQ